MVATKLKSLSCANCDTTLFERDPIYKMNRKILDYKDTVFVFTTGQKMRVSLCTNCYDVLDDNMKDFIMERHYLTWADNFPDGLQLKLK